MATNQENYPEMPRIRVKPPTPATSTTTTTTTGASPRVTVSTPTATATGAAAETPTAGAARKIAIAVDLSDESAFAVKWAVHHYLRPGDAVVLLHVRPTSVLYGADWGSVDFDTTNISTNNNDKDKGDGSAVNVENENEIDDVKDKKEKESKQKLEDDFDAFTSSKASDLAQPLIQAQVPYKIHIVKDHDMKERLCLEVERHGFNAVIMGSRGFGASKRGSNGRLGSVSDYCVRHCVCPVVVVRYPDEKDVNDGDDAMVTVAEADEVAAEDEEEYHDASDERKATA